MGESEDLVSKQEILSDSIFISCTQATGGNIYWNKDEFSAAADPHKIFNCLSNNSCLSDAAILAADTNNWHQSTHVDVD